MLKTHYFFKTASLILLLISASNLFAASFNVKPTRIFVQTLPQSSLSIKNQGDTEVIIQAELLKWAQARGVDVYTPARDVIISPPMFKIPPGETQIVRVHSLLTDAVNQERTYRVILQELPSPNPLPSKHTIATILRMSVPIFILPETVGEAQLAWKVSRTEKGLLIRAKNTSNSHIQLTSLKLVDDAGSVLFNQKIFVYILAGQSYTWSLKMGEGWQSTQLKISVDSDRDKLFARTNIILPSNDSPPDTLIKP